MAYYTPIMSTYFNEKYHWSEDIFLSIDWLASDKEYKQLSTGHWIASFKLQNGIGPIQYVLHQHKSAQYPACPRCHLSPETNDHVLCCPQAQTSWLQQWCSIETVFKSILHTPNSIFDAFENGIGSWQEGDPNLQWPFPIPSDNDPINQSINLLSLHKTVLNRMVTCTARTPLPTLRGCNVHLYAV